MKRDKKQKNFIKTTIGEFLNENVEITDRTKIKSKQFFISNLYKKGDTDIKYIELKPFNHDKVDKIFIYSNSVVFYDKYGIPIDEIRNINMDSNEELVTSIENRLIDLM